MKMCDSCGTRITILSKKVCGDCHQNFCVSCIHSRRPKGPFICFKCEVFSHDVIERSQLENLKLSDLKYFTKLKEIDTPLTCTQAELVEIILGYQAKQLSLKARKAIREVRGSGGVSIPDDFLSFDTSTLEPHTSAYRYSSSPNSKTLETAGASLGGHESRKTGSDDTDNAEFNQGSKRLKKDFDITTVMNLDDLQQMSQINELSVRQLKIILKRNCMDYKGCVEKQELLERVERLWHAREKEKLMEEKIASSGDPTAENDFLCKVCMDAPVDCVLLECGHMLTCVKCGRQLSECPVCRQYVIRVVHAFKI